MKDEFTFSSADKQARMRAVEWLPEGEPKAVLHIFQGAEEAACCREELAEFFKNQGFVVIDSYYPDSVMESQVQEAMQRCLTNLKRKYPDIPYLLLGLSKGAVAVHSFVNHHPEAVEGLVLADTKQKPQKVDTGLPILQISGVKENRQEVFQKIYHWTVERLDEMLYRAAVKHNICH